MSVLIDTDLSLSLFLFSSLHTLYFNCSKKSDHLPSLGAQRPSLDVAAIPVVAATSDLPCGKTRLAVATWAEQGKRW
jgi:hypothetical protein